ncbi:hypothetical protein M9458_050064, partial [Cirrhinus mrigala]
ARLCRGPSLGKPALKEQIFQRSTVVESVFGMSFRPFLRMPMATLRGCLCLSSSAALVKSKGDLRITVRNAPLNPPLVGAGSVSFGAPEEDRMSIAASKEGFTPDEADESAEQPPPPAAAALSESEAELAAMLLRAAKSIDLEVPKAPSPERSRLDDWFLGSCSDVPPRSTPVPFFPEVHEELTKTWRAPYTAHSRLSSSLLTTLDGGAASGYVDVPQVERAVAVHLCLQNAATWRNRPRLPSKACKLSSALAAKAYSAAGQAASALHAMAILQVHQAKALKQLHQGGSDPRLMQELRTASDFALRATKVTARSLGQVMSTMVVQERHLWLNLAQMSDADKVRFLDAPISQAGLFGDTFSAVQKQTEAIKHILPRRESTKPSGACPPSARRRGRPPVAAKTPAPPPATTSSEISPLPRRRAGRKGAAPSGQATAKNTRKPAKRLRRLLFRGHLHLAGRGDVLPPQVLSRSLSSRELGVKVGAACRSVTLLQNASSSGLPHRGYVSDCSLDPTCSESGGVVIAPQPVSLVDPDSPARLYNPIQTAPAQFQRYASVLHAEIAVLLAKNAIEPVPPAEMKSGFYSPYFIVPKKSGGLRPILDLRILNRMLTAKCIFSCIRQQDWFAAIDLKDAYFHVSILPRHRPFLRFAFEGQAYQYRVLPFGLALSPRVFTKVAEDGHPDPHLDDWLIIAHSRDLLCEHRDLVLQHLSHLGFQVNQEKSRLSPVQSISFLGMELDSVNMSARLTNERTHLFRHKTAAPGAYGSRSHSYAARTAPYETASALASWPNPEMGMAPWHVPGRHYPGIPCLPTGQHMVVNMPPRRAGVPGASSLAPHPLLGPLRCAIRPSEGPHEPLASVELKYLSLKTSLLIALMSIKRVGDLHAFSVSESCLEFGPADSHVTLRPRPGYVPKVPTTPFRDQVVNLQALPPEEADPALTLLCPVRALRTYVDRTRSFRRSEQLFVCFGGQQMGNAVSKQRLAHWVVDAITLAYQCQGEP